MIKPDPPASLADTREAIERMDARGEHRHAGRRGAGREHRARSRRVGRRVADRRADQLVRQPGARGADRGDRRAPLPGLPGHALVGRAARVPRVRADADRVHELVRAAEGRELRQRPAGAARRRRRQGRREHPALGRRPDDDAGGRAEPDLRRSSPGPPAASPARCSSRARRASTTSSPSTWAARRPTSRCARTASRRSAARPSIGHFRIKVPSVNVHTVGAGGGSIAHVPELTKALRVGPQSAGADPGPAAYGKGGAEPTVTDANVVLGHLPPRLLGGEMELDVEAARAAVQTIADAMGLAVGRGGGRGHPRDRQREHGRRAAARLGAARPRPARLRARRLRRRGAAARERGRGDHGLVPGARPAGAGAALRHRRPRRRLPRRVRADATSASSATPSGGEVARDPRRARRAGDRVARRRGHRRGGAARSPTAPTCATTGRATRSRSRSTRTRCGDGLADLEERFNALHEQLYGFRMTGTAGEIVNLRAIGFGAVPKPELPVGERGGADASGAVVDEHDVVFDGERMPTKIYDRAKLAPGNSFDGPAIVTEFDSTTVVLPGYAAESTQLQHPHQPEGVRRESDDSHRRAADRRDPDDRRRPDHPGHHRGRAQERPLRDGRGALPLGDEPRHPRAARRVPDDHRPARPHGRRPVRRVHQRDDGGLGPGRSTRAT